MNSGAGDISTLEDALGHRFRQRALLEQALTHSSYAREAEAQSTAGSTAVREADNEQMEFLGDAVLSFVVSQELFRRFPRISGGRTLQVAGPHRERASPAASSAENCRLESIFAWAKVRTAVAAAARALCWSMPWRRSLLLCSWTPGSSRAPLHSAAPSWSPSWQRCTRQATTKLPVMDYKSALQEAGACQRTPSAQLRNGERRRP